MTNTEKLDKIEKDLSKGENSMKSMELAILRILAVCREQEEQIEQLMEYVTSLQASVGSNEAQINYLDRWVDRLKEDVNEIKWKQ